MTGQASKTQRLDDRDRLLGKINFALFLGSLWLGMTAASAALLTSLTNDDTSANIVAASASGNEPVARTIADGRYQTWDDVATAPLPHGERAPNGKPDAKVDGKVDSKAGRAPVSKTPTLPRSGNGSVRPKLDRKRATQMGKRKQRRVQQFKIRHDQNAIVDM